MSTVFAYCRVSTTDQDTGVQEAAIKKAYPDCIVRTEKKSGTSMVNREILNLLLEMIGEDDKLVVWKLDRLARSVKDLSEIVELLESKGASLEIIDQSIDTSTASGKAFLQMLGVFAEFETNLRRERQLAGVAKAKAEHPEKYQGRKPSIDRTAVLNLVDAGMSAGNVAKKLGIGRASVYRLINEQRKVA